MISRRILFKKINVMLKVRLPKPKICICNIPIDSNNIVNVLQRDANINGLLAVKLKRKFSYRVRLFFAVSPEIIYQALMYLNQNNNLYHDIDIAVDNVPRNLLSLKDQIY